MTAISFCTLLHFCFLLFWFFGTRHLSATCTHMLLTSDHLHFEICFPFYMIRHQNLSSVLSSHCVHPLSQADVIIKSHLFLRVGLGRTCVRLFIFFTGPEREKKTSLIIRRLAGKQTPVVHSLTVCWLFNTWIKGGKKLKPSEPKWTNWSNNVIREWQSASNCWSARGPITKYTLLWVFISVFLLEGSSGLQSILSSLFSLVCVILWEPFALRMQDCRKPVELLKNTSEVLVIWLYCSLTISQPQVRGADILSL